MGEELPRNVSLCNCHCRDGAQRRRGLRAGARAAARPGDAAPSALLSLTPISSPSAASLALSSLGFQNLSTSSSSPWPPPPLPGILYPHIFPQVPKSRSFLPSRVQLSHLLLREATLARVDPQDLSSHDPVLYPAYQHLKSPYISFPDVCPTPAPG